MACPGWLTVLFDERHEGVECLGEFEVGGRSVTDDEAVGRVYAGVEAGERRDAEPALEQRRSELAGVGFRAEAQDGVEGGQVDVVPGAEAFEEEPAAVCVIPPGPGDVPGEAATGVSGSRRVFLSMRPASPRTTR